MVKYTISVKTGNQAGAGTDSNIFVKLYGVLGETDEVRLNGYIRGDAFERNKVDTITLEFNDIGDIYKFDLRSDCKYGGSDWLINKIEITKEGSQKATFQIQKWIKDKSIKTFFVTSGLTISDDYKEEYIHFDSGKRISSLPKQCIEFDENIKVDNGFKKSELVVTEIDTHSKLDLSGKFPLKAGAIEAAISFALDSHNSTTNSVEVNFSMTKEVHLKDTISNDSIDEKDYRVMVNALKKNHVITIGKYRIDVPEYLNHEFGGFKEVKN